MKLKTFLVVVAIWAPQLYAKSPGFGLSVAAGYIPYSEGKAPNSPNAEAEEPKKFYFHGASATATIHLPGEIKTKHMNYGLGIHAEGLQLQNNEVEEGETEGRETITATGGGLTFLSSIQGNFQLNLALAYVPGKIVQTGDTPKTQNFSSGFSARLGMGFGPLPGDSGIFVRFEPQWIRLMDGTEVEDEEKLLSDVEFTNANIMVGLALMFGG